MKGVRTNTPDGVPCVADVDTSKIAEGFDAREWIVAGLNYINTDIGWLETRVKCNWSSMSPEEIRRAVNNGKAPRQVQRFDKNAGEMINGKYKDPAQVHFKDCNNCALYKNGTWKHKPPRDFYLEKATKEWLHEIGWQIPSGY